MKLFKITIIFAISIIMLSCLERSPRRGSDNTIQSSEGPRVMRDTIFRQVVIVDTVNNQPKEIPVPVFESRPAVTNTRTSPSQARHTNDDNYDRANSGFFDQYQRSYGGDPNANLQPTRTVIQTNAEEIERQKGAIAKSIDILEQQNKENHEIRVQQERDREAHNARIQKQNEEIDREQREQQQRNNAKRNQGRTLDTNILIE